MSPEVTLVYHPACPNVAQARANLRCALAEVGLPLHWREHDRSAPDTPAELSGYGSPTVLVAGRDVCSEEPAGEGASCRLYDGGREGFVGVPPVAAIAEALRQAAGADRDRRSGWARSLAVVPAVLVALLPKLACPACWPAYAGVLSSLGLGFVASSTYLLPLTAAFLTVAVAALAWRARDRRGFGAFFLGLGAAAVVLAGKFVLESSPAMFAGIGVLVSASLWNSWPRKAGHNAACPACAPADAAERRGGPREAS